MVCANCGTELGEGHKFCGICGAKVVLPEVQAPSATGTMLKESAKNGYLFYMGEPSGLAFWKFTGTVRIYDDRIECEKLADIKTTLLLGMLFGVLGVALFGAALGGALGVPLGMWLAVIVNKRKSYEARVERYYFRDISQARTGKFSMKRTTLVITMKMGKTFTLCCSKADSKEPVEFLELMKPYLN